LKPTSDANYTSANKPSIQLYNYQIDGAYGDVSDQHGVNNNSYPAGNAYTGGSPSQTSVTAFRAGGNEAFNYGSYWYWSSTEYNTHYAWGQYHPGGQYNTVKYNTYSMRVVRRVII